MKLSYSKQMKAVIIALTLCLLAIFGLRAQTTDNRYSVSGSVRLFVDVRGQAPEEVPTRLLTTHNGRRVFCVVGTGTSGLNTVSDSSGNFTIPGFAPGRYILYLFDIATEVSTEVTVTDHDITGVELIIRTEYITNASRARLGIKNNYISLIGNVYGREAHRYFKRKYNLRLDLGGPGDLVWSGEEWGSKLHNRVIYDYLDRKYGNRWRNDLISRKDVFIQSLNEWIKERESIDSLRYLTTIPGAAGIEDRLIDPDGPVAFSQDEILFRKVVSYDRDAAWPLIAMLNETATTGITAAPFPYEYTVGDVAYLALQQIIPDIPTMKLLGIKDHDPADGYWPYWRKLNENPRNRRKFRRAVERWYDRYEK